MAGDSKGNVKQNTTPLNGATPINQNRMGQSIDIKTTTVNGAVKNLIENFYKENTLAGIQEFPGQIYRVKSSKELKSVEGASLGDFFSSFFSEYFICKVRVFSLDYARAIPCSYDDVNSPTYKSDVKIIDSYPDFIYLPQEGVTTPLSVGDIVNVTFTNLETREDGKILKKLSSKPEGQGSLPPIGSNCPESSAKEAFKEKIAPPTNQPEVKPSSVSPNATEKSIKPNSENNKKPEEPLDPSKNIHKVFDTDKITLEDFKNIFPNSKRDGVVYAEIFYNSFLKLFKKYQVNTPSRIAALCGQLHEESGDLRYFKELASPYNKVMVDPNMVIGKLYGQRKTLGNETQSSKPGFDAMPDKAYRTAGETISAENRERRKKKPKPDPPLPFDSKDFSPNGDGPAYLGRGLVQLTGRANYNSSSKKLGVDIEKNPELVESPDLAAETAFEFFNRRTYKGKNLYKIADEEDYRLISRLINGKDPALGLEGRLSATNRALKILTKYV